MGVFKKIIYKIAKDIIAIEHVVYCSTGCKVELPLHKAYYKYCRQRYEHYVNTVLAPKFDW